MVVSALATWEIFHEEFQSPWLLFMELGKQQIHPADVYLGGIQGKTLNTTELCTAKTFLIVV
ncbi:UNVERIFIED_CONTAM: hypothetical protein FKN15_058657 [Acipenser sinensis]